MNRKNQLIMELQRRLKELKRGKFIEQVRELETEVAFIQRGAIPSQEYEKTVRLRWALDCGPLPKFDPMPVPLKTTEPIPKLPPNALDGVTKHDRARWAYARFCVHCDGEMREIDRRWVCKSRACASEAA